MNDVTAHMVVKNEDRFIWYAISSVLPYVDKFLIFDTGSTDKTVLMIKKFRDNKIIFEQKGESSAKEITKLRQKQIEMTKTSWLWIVDGDEIYPKKTAEKISLIIREKRAYEGIIVHRYDLLGDIYHYQDEKVGAYDQFGEKGHYVLRLVNKRLVGNLQTLGDYPDEYFADGRNNPIKNHGKNKFAFVKERIFHAMYLERSTGRNGKILNRKSLKIELGRKIPKEDLPEIFFAKKSSIVPDVTCPMSFKYRLLASVVTPVKKLKRFVMPNLFRHPVEILKSRQTW